MIFFQVFVLFFMVVITLGLQQLEEGESCFRETTGEKGTCTRLSECPVALAAVKYNINPQLCGLSGIHTIVCCLDSTDKDTSSASSSPLSTTSSSSSSPSSTISSSSRRNCSSSPVPLSGTIGAACVLEESGQAGKCALIKDCPKILEAFTNPAPGGKPIRPQTCFMMGTVQVVCCGV